MSTLIFVFNSEWRRIHGTNSYSCSCSCSFLHGEPRMTREWRMNDRRIEWRLTASSWRAELCDARGWDHRERLCEFVPTKGNEDSQGIVLRLKICPPLSSLSPVKPFGGCRRLTHSDRT